MPTEAATLINRGASNIKFQAAFLAPGKNLTLNREGEAVTATIGDKTIEVTKAGLEELAFFRDQGMIEVYGSPILREPAAKAVAVSSPASAMTW